MMSLLKSAFCGVASRTTGSSITGLFLDHLKVLSAGLKTYHQPPDYSDVVLPERPKLKFMNKVPNLKKVKKEMKNLNDIRGPAKNGTAFTTGQYGIVALGGGYLHWGHMEMMRLTINRHIDPRTTFALWRISGPYKPITRRGLGKRMGGGKGAIDHYVTPVRYGRLVLEVGGSCELGEVEPVLTEVAKKLPFPAKVVSRESLAAMQQKEAEEAQSNQNPWTFKMVVTANMLGIRKVLSPFDLHNHGRFSGKFHNPGRVPGTPDTEFLHMRSEIHLKVTMKPSRASERASTRGPKMSGKRRQKRLSQDPGPSRETCETQKQPQKRLGKGGENGAARKVKGQEKWKLLPKTSITALESILDLSILSVLTMRGKGKDEYQRHLNQLKDRFLASCAQLKVPPRKQGDMLQVSRLHQAESKKKTVGQRTLQALEDEVRTVVGALEQMEVKMDSLEQEIRTLRRKLEDEEESAQEILQLSENGVLNLPALPPQVTRELPLQDRMVKDLDAAALASALHSSAEVREVRAFLELAHEQADQLLLNTQGPSAFTGPEDSPTRDI
ncbi:hypothetical protein SKAU_G00260930 [Synaphobranchus kaupii]|uniref:Large ribosomal subunit protein uL16m n=1 Tax=Synaphobranchus kaupii TaxID=118154 RepID=A0A9Q1ISI9_SYNKA|nr:hypothetical protein SKAU_G00260930 [Synaphobranchus kaupii]